MNIFMKRIINRIKTIGITTRMILYFYVFLVIQLLIIGWFINSLISSYLEDTYINNIQLNNNSLLQHINYIRINYEVQSDKILSNRIIQDTLTRNYDQKQGIDTLNDILTVDNLLYDPTDTFCPVILQKNGIIYQPYSGRYAAAVYENVVKSKAYETALKSDGSNLWLATNENMMENKKEYFLYICRALKSLEIKPRVLGQLMIQFSMDSLDNIFKKNNLRKGESYAILDQSGYYLYHTGDINQIGEKVSPDILNNLSSNTNGYKFVNKGGESYLLSYSHYSGKGWDIIHVLPISYIFANGGTVRNYIILIMISAALVLLPLLYLLSANLSRPIKRLESAVEQFGNGNFDIREKADRMDEIGHLQNSFNKMANDISSLLSKIDVENKQRRLLELNMLEYQINPHFLYNSLDSINWMAKVSGNKDIEDLVCALAKFLRVGLNKGKEIYRVNDELEHIRQYLLISKIRFKDCFQFEIQAQPEVLKCLIIKIILQPVIENAIKYGIDKKSTNGFIKISANKVDNSILFEVTDNGPGMSKTRLEDIRNLLSDHTEIDSDSQNGFGLFNVNQRIWLHYGDGYGITLYSNLGAGTTVQIRLPFVEA